ncbi:hypothetical protein JXB37_01770 [candidate division WOR-3 bacterium]|nr:hypothetical protein [candidate division WOR-3 bacterium]
MNAEACVTKQPKGLSAFERYLTVWVPLCIGAGILLGRISLRTRGWFRPAPEEVTT